MHREPRAVPACDIKPGDSFKIRPNAQIAHVVIGTLWDHEARRCVLEMLTLPVPLSFPENYELYVVAAPRIVSVECSLHRVVTSALCDFADGPVIFSCPRCGR